MAGLHDPSDLDVVDVLGLSLCSLASQSIKPKPAGIPNLIIQHSGVRLLPKQNGCLGKSPKVIRIPNAEITG